MHLGPQNNSQKLIGENILVSQFFRWIKLATRLYLIDFEDTKLMSPDRAEL